MISKGIWRQVLKTLFVNERAEEVTPFHHYSMTSNIISNIKVKYLYIRLGSYKILFTILRRILNKSYVILTKINQTAAE